MFNRFKERVRTVVENVFHINNVKDEKKEEVHEEDCTKRDIPGRISSREKINSVPLDSIAEHVLNLTDREKRYSENLDTLKSGYEPTSKDIKKIRVGVLYPLTRSGVNWYYREQKDSETEDNETKPSQNSERPAIRNIFSPKWNYRGPAFVFGRDILSQMIYEKALNDGREADETIRIIVIGCKGQGKSSFVRRLLGEPLDNVKTTEGVDIIKCVSGEDGAVWKRQLNKSDEEDSIKRIATQVRTVVPGSMQFVSDPSDEGHFENRISKELERQSFEIKRFTSLHIWDFGGDFINYATHQLFHSRKAVYVLVFSLSIDLNSLVGDENCFLQKEDKTMADYFEFWLNSIHSFVGNADGTEPAVILVGTHADQLENAKDADKYFEAVQEMFIRRKLGQHIKDQFAVSMFDQTGEIENLRRTIISYGRRQNERETVPAKWIPFEFALKKRQHENIISTENILQLAREKKYGFKNEDEVKLFLEFHHKSGNLFFFNEDEMARHVVVNPLFLLQAFRCLMVSERFCSKNPNLLPLWHTLKERAILEKNLIVSVWNNESEEFIKHQKVLISYLKKHRIIGEAQQIDMTGEDFCTKPLGYYIVPSLLRKADDGSVKEFLEGKSRTPVSLVYEFENETVVPAIFQRVTAAAIGTWSVLQFKGKPLLFQNVCVFKISVNHAGMFQQVNNRIEIQVVHLCVGMYIDSEMATYLRRFTEVMIGIEFRKLRPLEMDFAIPVKESVRCLHDSHLYKGSLATYGIEFIQNVKEARLCCPDHVSHENLNPIFILDLWYNKKIKSDNIQKRKLTDKDYSILSTTAVGKGWEHLASHLEITEKTVQQIDINNKEVSMKIFRVFKTWDLMNGDNATLDKLVESIRTLPKTILSKDALNNLSDNFC